MKRCRRAIPFHLFGLVLLLKCFGVVHAQPTSQPNQDFWVPDGPVFALAETNDVLYIGGGFSHVGPVTGRFVPINPETGEIAGPFEKIFGTINVAIPDGNDGWFIGGIFTTVGTIRRTNIVHIFSDRTVDPNWILIPNDPVTSAVLVGSRLFIGGHFTEINGRKQPYLAEVNPQTGQLLPLNMALNGAVLSLAANDSKLFLGGLFTRVMTEDRLRLAAFDLSQNGLLEWRVDCDSLVGFGVTLLSVAEGRLYVSGDFTSIGTATRSRLAAIEPDSGRVLPWNLNLSGTLPITGLAVRSNLVYIAGSFGSVSGSPRAGLAAVDRETGQPTNWKPQISIGQFFALAIMGNTVYLGGDFNYGHTYLAAIDAVTGEFNAWDPVPSAPVTLLVAATEALYVGGQFHSIGGVARNQLAALDVRTGRVTSWNPVITGDGIYSLALAGDTLFAGGYVRSAGGQPRDGLCAVRLSDASVLPFDARLGDGAGHAVAAKRLVVSETNLFVGGAFTSAGNAPANGFVILNTQNGQVIELSPSSVGEVSSFAISQGKLYLSGTFSELAGQARNGLAAFDLRSGHLLDWQPTTDIPGGALFGSFSQVFLTGQFAKVNGLNQRYIASLDGVTGGLNDWRPAAPAPFLSMTTLGSTFYGVGASGLRRALDVLNGTTSAWTPVFMRDGSPAPIRCILPTSSKLFVGGEFSDVNDVSCPWLAAFSVTNCAPIVSLKSPLDQVVIRLPTALEFGVEAYDPDGAISRIDYYVNGHVVAWSSEPPYSASWRPQIISNYVVTAVAVDNLGERGMSLSSHLTALPPEGDQPPSILVTSPENGMIIREGDPLTVGAAASDPDSRVMSVEFYLRTNLIAILTNPPYVMVLSNLVRGPSSITARVTDEYGVTATNGPIDFRVNAFPTILCTPVPSFEIAVGTDLVLLAAPTDIDGEVKSVSFFAGTNLLGVRTTSPYSVTVSNLPAGSYSFVVEAVDDLGGIGLSAPVNIVVYVAPVNDAFAQRIKFPFSLGQASGSNTYASAEPGEPRHVLPLFASKSVWWSWTPDFTGTAFVSTSGSSFDTLLAVYSGTNLTTLQKLASNDNERLGLQTSLVTLWVTNGTAIQIVVDGRLGVTGSIALTVGPAVSMQISLEQPNQWTVRYGGPTNIVYILQSSPDSISWVSIRTNLPGVEQRFSGERSAVGLQLNRLLLSPHPP